MELSPQNSEYFRTWRFFLSEEIDGKVALVLQKAIPRSQILNNESQGPAIKVERGPEHTQSVAIPTPPSSDFASTSSSSPTPTSDQPHAAIVEIYNQILGSFYSISLNIPSTTFSTTLTTVESFVRISSSLSCTALIAPSLTFALLTHHHTLFTSISRDPARYLLLAILLQSTCMYKESITHIIGAHPSWPWPTPRSVLPPHIISLVVRKAEELEHMCVETERELLLTIDIHRSGPVQPQHHNTFGTWFTVQLFRDTLARTFHSLEKSKDRTLKRGTLYRQIAKGAEEYMPRGEMRQLVQRVMPSALGGIGRRFGITQGVCARSSQGDSEE